MKKRIVPFLCAFVLSVTAGNGAYARTKTELKKDLAETGILTKDGLWSPNERAVQKVNQFLDLCGDLTDDQFEAMYNFAGAVSTLITEKSLEGMSIEEINKDPDVIRKVTNQINVLKKSIPDLHVELKDGCALLGTAVLNGASLNVENLRAGISEEELQLDSSENKPNETTTTSTPKKRHKGTIKTTGSNMDLSALSVTAVISLLGIVACALMAHKKRLFEGK